MPEGDRSKMGGTMRLGSRVTVLRPRSRAFDLYGGEGDIALEVRSAPIKIIAIHIPGTSALHHFYALPAAQSAPIKIDPIKVLQLFCKRVLVVSF